MRCLARSQVVHGSISGEEPDLRLETGTAEDGGGGATGRGGSYWGLNFEESGFMLRSTAAPLATCSS